MTSPDPTTASAPGAAGDLDFDQWWATHGPTDTRQRVRIRGQLVPIPNDIPLRVSQGVNTGGTLDDAVILDFLAELYSVDVVEGWITAGMGAQEMGTVLAWSMVRASGDDTVTFGDAIAKAGELSERANAHQAAQAEARDTLAKAAAGEVGRAEREHAEAVLDAGKALSSATGAPSSPTSDASTASPRRTSPSWARSSSASSSAT